MYMVKLGYEPAAVEAIFNNDSNIKVEMLAKKKNPKTFDNFLETATGYLPIKLPYQQLQQNEDVEIGVNYAENKVADQQKQIIKLQKTEL